jgi:hypothetical protein
MKKILLIFSIISLNILNAQNIVYMEYFFDSDPGRNNANNLSITSDSVIYINTNLDISGLCGGFHTLFIRAKDNYGRWSFVHQKCIYKENIPVDPALNIVKMEYFIDEDPGIGKAVDVPISADNIVVKTFTADISSLSDDMHILYVRVKDADGVWSFVHQKLFLKEKIHTDLPKISAVSYYFTKDDFISETVTINSFSPADSIHQSFIADLSKLPDDGIYNMHVFVYDEKGVKSLSYIHEVDITLTDIDETARIPKKYDLSQNYPNPFNPETEIKFSIPKTSYVSLTIYNSLGQKVADIIDKEYKPGYYKINWNADKYSSGVYFYRLRSDNFVSTKRMILLK